MPSSPRATMSSGCTAPAARNATGHQPVTSQSPAISPPLSTSISPSPPQNSCKFAKIPANSPKFLDIYQTPHFTPPIGIM
ncbi:hypothetical protein K491DRAFT_458257 [Lophiostoma macrostomum CBS 122681]|uniref:Uncharacterized protein n=1 Tax=Lophiostoma macrostomum CBS 122681 TaxID=1314788 RepID=A0A6A6T488_9PLEO|nr:hypothetical protein K491DRAFT_458257 [Lophiostoma macrostomum CBS 122681]